MLKDFNEITDYYLKVINNFSGLKHGMSVENFRDCQKPFLSCLKLEYDQCGKYRIVQLKKEWKVYRKNMKLEIKKFKQELQEEKRKQSWIYKLRQKRRDKKKKNQNEEKTETPKSEPKAQVTVPAIQQSKAVEVVGTDGQLVSQS